MIHSIDACCFVLEHIRTTMVLSAFGCSISKNGRVSKILRRGVWQPQWELESLRNITYDRAKSKNRSLNRSQNLDGIGVTLIRTFLFSSDPACGSVVYNIMRFRLSESQAQDEEWKNEPITMLVPAKCEGFSFAAYDCDSYKRSFHLTMSGMRKLVSLDHNAVRC